MMHPLGIPMWSRGHLSAICSWHRTRPIHHAEVLTVSAGMMAMNAVEQALGSTSCGVAPGARHVPFRVDCHNGTVEGRPDPETEMPRAASEW